MSIDLSNYGIFNERVQDGLSKTDTVCFDVQGENLLKAMKILKEQEGFLMLLDHVAVDWIKEDQFELFYELYSLKINKRLRVSTRVSRTKPVVKSLSSIWSCAEFQEREVFDLMGIRYEGHPDLRRLFLDDDWAGYPLQKDYKDDFMLELPDYVK